jgi:hypothetical protein
MLSNQQKAEEVARRIREVQKPSQDNSSQEKHWERAKIALEVNGYQV